jgi:hypothetical protein
MIWAQIFQAIAKAITNAYSTWSYLKESKQQAREAAQQAQEQADQRAKVAKYNMQQQKTSFLKSGVYFDSGSPVELINETYNVAKEDINAINADSLNAQKRLKRAGRTAFFSFLVDPVGNDSSGIASNIYSYYQNKSANNSSTSTFNNASNSKNTQWSGAAATSKTTKIV